MEYEEHEKRAWSVDFSQNEPSMLVSGSDDCKVLGNNHNSKAKFDTIHLSRSLSIQPFTKI
jgi:E3 ubiquitin-protein ligase RFWD2